MDPREEDPGIKCNAVSFLLCFFLSILIVLNVCAVCVHQFLVEYIFFYPLCGHTGLPTADAAEFAL